MDDLDAIYREQYGPLVGFVTRSTRDRALAEEIVQEAFLRAIDHRPANPRAWLYAVASNLVRDEARRHAVRRRHLHVVRGGEPATEAPETEAERHERRKRVRAALESLAERDREALLMHEDGASYDEIAERLGLSRGSVGTTLSRARRRLAEAWNELEGGAG